MKNDKNLHAVFGSELGQRLDAMADGDEPLTCGDAGNLLSLEQHMTSDEESDGSELSLGLGSLLEPEPDAEEISWMRDIAYRIFEKTDSSSIEEVMRKEDLQIEAVPPEGGFYH